MPSNPYIAVVLDTGVLSLVADKPGKNANVINAQNWLAALLRGGAAIYTPEICDYELRRELTRASRTASLTRLDALVMGTRYVPITTPIMRQAATLWAQSRNNATPTADPKEIDGDVILAAQALSLGYNRRML
jgi:predicted nucleic acid-binding protein